MIACEPIVSTFLYSLGTTESPAVLHDTLQLTSIFWTTNAYALKDEIYS